MRYKDEQGECKALRIEQRSYVLGTWVWGLIEGMSEGDKIELLTAEDEDDIPSGM
jgi:hypothetical protein